ncbi:MAG: class II glutamine amidotransferase [Ignavibacteria bacterium]|jgi:glutamine amidotransferase|nr:class II glutamine amidotransferase [Ignavibacteria bacterium]
MCRLLYVNSANQFEPSIYLKKFAEISKNSKEFQGHGWGCAYLQNGKWEYYKNVNPIWEDDFSKFPLTSRLIVHARSAFKDEGIVVENNMPFYDDKFVFIFNGELRGVKIKEEGRIGAEKIFNYIKRFYKGNTKEALAKGAEIINKKTSYIRAMNVILSDNGSSFVYSLFNEDEAYFTMHIKKENDLIVVCSEPFSGETGWEEIQNNSLTELKCL